MQTVLAFTAHCYSSQYLNLMNLKSHIHRKQLSALKNKVDVKAKIRKIKRQGDSIYLNV